MADLANLVLAVDSSAVSKGTAALDGLTAAGTRAEAASVGLGSGFKGAGAQAAAMATAAQLSARAAMDQAAGFGVATNAARINTLALRESLVVAREISRGNFTRLPGSLTLLAQGIGSQGGLSAFGSAISQQLGLVKTLQDAELAEAAAAAANAAAGVEAAARRAAANVLAADTEVALAEAQVRVTEGTAAEAAAQSRLAAAHVEVAAAAAEATVAEDALAVAMGRSAEASAASAAATRTSLSVLGASLGALSIAAGLAFAGVEGFKAEVRDSGDLDRFAEKLRLTKGEIEKAGGSVTYLGHNIQEISGLTVTWGDVAHGTFHAVAEAAGLSSSQFEDFWKEAFLETAEVGIFAAQSIVAAFASAATFVNKSGLIAGSLNVIAPGAGTLYEKANPSEDIAKAGQDAAAQFKKSFDDVGKFFHETLPNSIEDAAKKRLQKLSDSNNPRAPKKQSDHGLQEAIDKLQAEIKGQYDLAAAYGVSDAAAQRAIANQKGAEDAIQHKGGLDQFKALELQKIVATDVAQQAKTNADLQLQTSIRAQLNGQLADGTLTVSQYNEQLKSQTVLHKLNVDLENADAAHKQQVLDIIAQTIQLQTEQLQVEAQYQALKQIAANDNDIARIQLENSLLGKSNSERAVAIAQLEAIQQLKDIDPNGLLTTGERNNFVQSAINKAAAGVQTPFQQWAKDIPGDAKSINDALQSIEFKGFDSLASAIAGVVTGTESLGKAFQDISRQIIADIVQMTIKMLIFRAISGIFGGGFQSPADPTSLLSTTGGITHFATGGSMIIGGNGGVDNNVLSINGKPAAMVGRGETLAVYPNNGGAANNNSPQQIELTIVTAPSDDAWAKVSDISARQIGDAAPVIVKVASSTTVKALTRRTLMGG